MTLALAFLAGIVTVLSPCVLPLLPVILASAVGDGRWRPWGVVLGFAASFVAATLFLAALVSAVGLSPDVVRTLSGVILLACGLVLAVPALGHWFEMHTAAVAGASARIPARGGFAGGVLLGIGLGLAWTPCVGPIMASVISLALAGEVTGGAFAVAVAYALGTALPMAAVVFGGRALLRRTDFLRRNMAAVRTVFGALLIVAALLVLSGADRTIQVWLLHAFPGWENALTGWEPEP